MFSIVIPTWNNLPYLSLCVKSIIENSKFKHQIIIHVNDGSDGSLAWVKAKKNAGILDFTASDTNIGICYAVNNAAMLARHDYIVYMNDDMVCAPNWDEPLIKKIQMLDTNGFMLSGTMIQPKDTDNPCTIVYNFGEEVEEFNLDHFNKKSSVMKIDDWCGSTWPPTVVHKEWWHKVGGYSIEFSPGMSSDNDFSMKLWFAGCRIFMGLGDSLVYHFMQKSTLKIKKNNGSAQFLRKWGITASTFDTHFTRLGEFIDSENPTLDLIENSSLKYQRIRSRLKRIFV